jgi:hypothetical protein
MDTLTVDFSPDIKRIIRAFNSSDHVGTVIRIHFKLDRALDRVVRKFFPRSDALGLQYTGQRLRQLAAIGIPDQRLAAARLINEVRNRFAHKDRQEEITIKDVKSIQDATIVIYPKFSEDFTVVFRREGVDRDLKYSELSPNEKFCILGVMNVGFIAALVEQAQKLSGANGL